MSPRRRITVSAVGELLLLLADRAPRTRADVVAETGLPRAAVSAQLDVLTASGLVARQDDAPSSGGRPAARVAFDPRARSLLAVDLGAAHAVVALTDLDGTVLARRRESIAIADGPSPSSATPSTSPRPCSAGLRRPARSRESASASPDPSSTRRAAR